MIRQLDLRDLDEIREIHKSFYENEFSFPDFLSNFLGSFVVTDDNNETIICAGGVRTILESVIITNKNVDIHDRRLALYQVLDASSFISQKAGFDQLHAFIQDEKWLRHLKRIGFSNTKGQSLVLNLG